MSKSIKDQLLEKGLLKLAGSDKARIHKAYRMQKCRVARLNCIACTEWQYMQCMEKFGSGKD